MTRLNLRSDPKAHRHARNAFRIAMALLTSTSLLLPTYAYLSFKTGAWQYRAEFILLAIFGCIVVGGAWLSRQGRSDLGIKLIIGAVLFVGLGGSLLFYGLGLIVGLGLVLIPAIIAGQTLSPRGAGRAFLAGLAAGALALVLDLYGPPDRLASPEGLQVFLPIVTGLLVLILAVFMTRQISHYPLRIKLVTAFWLVALVPLSVVGFLNDRTARATLTEVANQALLTSASQTADGVDTFLKNNLADIQTAAEMPDWAGYLDWTPEQRAGSELEEELIAILKNFSRKSPGNIHSYALLDLQGRNLLDTLAGDIGQDEASWDYFLRPLQTDQPYISPVRFLPNGQAFLYFSSPVHAAAGGIAGVLRMRYRAAALQQLILQSNNLAGDESFAVLLDENQLVLAHGLVPGMIFKTVAPLDPARVTQLQKDGRLPPRSASELSFNLETLAQGLEAGATHPVFSAETESNSDGVEQVAVAPLTTRPWLVAFSQSQDVFLAPAAAQTRTTLLISLFFAVLVALAAISTAYLLSAPIARLTSAAERVTAGDLTVQAPAQADDEIGQLGKTFNAMTAQLRQTLVALEQRVAERTQALERSHTELQQAYEAIQEKHEQLLASEKMASLGRLSAGIAHEINNPLAATRSALAEVEKLVEEYRSSIGAAEVTPDDHQEIAQEMQHAVQLAKQAIERATGFVRGIKAQAREFAPQERMSFNAVPVIRESLLLVSHALRRANCTANFSSATDPIELYGSPGELAQVVTNLVTNAIDASVQKGGGPIRLHLASENGGVEFTVSDQGEGIAPDILPKIFDFLFTTKPVGQGTGLGLSIVHDIVTSGFGGTVSVRSQPGQGATFTLCLPRPPAE